MAVVAEGITPDDGTVPTEPKTEVLLVEFKNGACVVADTPEERPFDRGTVPETVVLPTPVEEFDAPEAVTGLVTFDVVAETVAPVDGAVPPGAGLLAVSDEFEKGP